MQFRNYTYFLILIFIQVVSEITVAVGGVQIEGPEVDYLTFQTSDSTINIDQFGHVIELYDFPSEYKTTDLVNAFEAFTSRSVQKESCKIFLLKFYF